MKVVKLKKSQLIQDWRGSFEGHIPVEEAVKEGFRFIYSRSGVLYYDGDPPAEGEEEVKVEIL